MLKQFVARFVVTCLFLLSFAGAAQAYYDGSELGYLDYVTINGQEFENFDERQIVFYPEDLRDGAVIIRGLMEAEQKKVPLTDLHVEITMNGGKSWKAAIGNGRWEYKFYPDIERGYDFSIRVVQNSISDFPITQNVAKLGDELWRIGAFELRTAVAAQAEKLTGQGAIALGWLTSYLPERLLDPETKELLVSFENLQTAAGQIVNGTIRVATKTTISLSGAKLQLDSIAFSPSGVSLEGALSVDFEGVTLADLPLNGVSLTLAGLNGDFSVVAPGQPFNLVLFKGTYGATLVLDTLILSVDTGQQVPVTVKDLSGALQFGSGYGNLQVPNLSLLADKTIGWGQIAAAQGLDAVASSLTIPGTDFKLLDIGGAINLSARSLSLRGRFQFPEKLGGGSVNLPQDTPLVLSAKGISTSGTLQFDAGNLPALDLSGFPTSLSALSLAIADNIPSGSLAGQVVLTSFANLPLDIAADIVKTGLNGLRVAVPQASYSYSLADFATLKLSKLALSYDAGDFSVELDGSITPTNSLVSSLSGIGESLAFEGLTIAQDAITLADGPGGWHGLPGGSAGFSGATVSLTHYGLGVEDNLFWVGLKGLASLGGSTATATARIFHDGTTSIDGIDLSNVYFALGDFFLKVKGDNIDEAGAIASNTLGAIGGLPQALIDSLPAGVLNDAQELVVQLNNFQVDLASRSVTVGSVGYAPTAPFDVTLGPVSLTFAGITFTTSSASIDGSINLAGLGLPISDIPFTDLHLGGTGIAGDIDLIGDAGPRTVTIMEGERGFSLKLDTLSVNVDTRKSLANMVSLETFDGSLLFGSTYNNLEIPDLNLLADNVISWGKGPEIDAQASLARLTLPGGFAIGDLGGAIDLDAKSLSISGTIHLPASLNNATLTIPAGQPITLSVGHGLSTVGPLVFDPGALPAIPLAGIDTILTGLSLGINEDVISGSLEGDLVFKQFGGLKIAVNASFDSNEGLQEVKIASGNVNKTFDLEGFASLTLKGIKAGKKNEIFYVELDGGITPTHTLFGDYQKPVEFTGLRIYKAAIEFAGDVGGWDTLPATTMNINAASVSLEEYGLGVSNGLLWFGLKGQAEYMGGEASITAKIFHDKTYEISDLAFDGLYLALGDFSLRTKAEMVDGLISGAGSINAGFLTEYLPDEIKDPLTGELNVSFENLAVDLENKKVTGGTVVLNFKQPLTPDLGAFSAVIRSVSFGFDGASVDGDFSLNSLAGIDIPTPPTNLSFADIELSPQGFAGSVTYNAGRTPVSLPVLTGDYGITLLLSELTVAVDTTAVALLDKLRLTDLDGSIKLGSGYKMSEELTQLHMLADQGITWGVQQAAADLADMGEDAAKLAANEAAAAVAGLDFKIPGTEFHVNNINGRLYLNDKKLKVWGKVQLPANLGGGSIGLTEASALVLSASGVSTTGEVDIDTGSLGDFALAGFAAEVQSFSFGVSSNSVSGSLAAKIKLAKFDNIPIDVTASLSNDGLSGLTVVTSESPVGPYSLAGFADLTLTTIGGGYEDGEITVILDGDLALDPAVADVARSFSFSELSISRSSITMPNIDSPVMFPADLPAFSVGNDLAQIALTEFGFKVKDNLMWLILNGEATILNQTAEGSILISHKGDIDLGDMRADNIVVNIGDFRLTGALAKVDGVWSGEASLYLGEGLHRFIDPAVLNAFGELPVSVSNLDIDIGDIENVTLNSGEIEFAPEGGFTISDPDYFTASLPSVKVGVSGGSVFAEIGAGASISFDQGILAGYTEGLSFSDFGLANNGLQATVTWADSVGKTMAIVPNRDGYNIDATLTEIKVTFDSSKGFDSGMFVLGRIDGNLTFGTAYNAPDLKPALSLVAGAYTFDATGSALTLVEGLKLKEFSGSVDFANEQISLSGLFNVPLAEGKEIGIDVSDWSISATGFSGSIAAVNLDLSGPLGFGAADSETILMRAAEIEFDRFSVSNASLDLGVKLKLTASAITPINLNASLGVDNEGTVDFAVDAETSTNLSADLSFATLKVKKLGSGYDSTDGLFFALDTEVTMNQQALLSGLPTLNLEGIEVYAGKIKVNNVGVGIDGNYKVSLAGVDLTLTALDLGYGNSMFYLHAAGGLTIGSLCEGSADITLYDDGNFLANEIGINMTNSAMTIRGELAIHKGHDVYGTGYGADLDIVIGGSLPVSGSLILGNKEIKSGETVTGSFVYWHATVKVGTTLSLAPLPLNIYSLGGGVGYNVRISAVAGNDAVFTPTEGHGLSLTALVDMGTTDNGNAWFGKFGLTFEPSDMRVVLDGQSWIMEGRNPTVDPHLSAVLELGGSPTIFHLAASINVTKEAGGMDMVDVNGQVDVLFAANDWHVYFGSKQQPLSVTVLHYLGGQGYLQIDRSGFAMGVRKQFDLEGSAWIFYGRLYGGGEIDIAAGIQPFYVDARGRVWIGLEAGVKVSGSKYEIFSAYAELGGRFRAPPVYIGLHGEVRYSLLWGTVSGTWDMTFTYPKHPPEGAGDGGIETVPLLAYSTPEQGATDVDRFTPINIKTNVPINEPFQYDDDDQWYYLLVDNFVDRQHVPDSIRVSSPQNFSLPVLGGLSSSVGVQYNPGAVYPSGQLITYKTTLKLHEWNYDTFAIGQRVKEEVVDVAFTTSADDPSFRERVYEVYPGRATTPVYGDTDIYIVSKAIQDGEQWKVNFPLEKLKFQLVNAKDEVIAGTIEGNLVTYDEQAGSRRFLTRFTPEEPLIPVRMVEDLTTGVKAPAVKQSDGSYQNPFIHLSSAASQDQVAATPVASIGSVVDAGAGTAAVAGKSTSTQQTVVSQALGVNVGKTSGRSAGGKSSGAGDDSDSGTETEETSGRSARGDSYGAGDVGDSATETEEAESNYRWFWDGDYKIQVVDNRGGTEERVYVSRFSLEVPAEGEDVNAYGSTADVVEASLTDPYFYVNYTVDQDVFQADMDQARRDIVESGVSDLFWQNMEREPVSYPVYVVDTGTGWGAGAETHVEWHEGTVCGQFDSPHDLAGPEGTEAVGLYPANWSDVRTRPSKAQWWIYMLAMQGCESLEPQIAALEQQLADYREESFVRHSVADFRSIELRFSTGGPINWSEVDLRIGFAPTFADDEQEWPYDVWSGIFIKDASSFQATEGEYIVRSEVGSLNHRLELMPDGEFNGQVMVGYLQFWTSWGKQRTHLGSLSIRDKGLQQSNIVNEDGREFSVEAGRNLIENMAVNTLKTSRPLGSTRRDGLVFEGVRYTNGSN
jgi:hypothetical protein